MAAREPFLIATGDYALFDGEWKLIETRQGRRMLYRVASDPSESSDQLAAQPQTAQRMQAKLKEHKKEFPAAPESSLNQGPPGGRNR